MKHITIAILFLHVGSASVSSQSAAGSLELARKYVAQQLAPNTTPPQFLYPLPPNPVPSEAGATLLLFVHGIFGDAITTWKDTNGWSLPRLIRERPEYSRGYDAFAYGYPTEMFKAGTFNIVQAAGDLLSVIADRKLLEYDKIYFVTHSMGGLVALQALVTSERLASKTVAVVTYATPFDGASLSAAAQLLSPGGEDMLPIGTSNSFLEALHVAWKTGKANGKIKTNVACAYELLPFPGLGRVVVATGSARSLCDNPQPLAIAADHIGIVKAGSAHHPSVRHLATVLRGELLMPVSAAGDLWVCSASVKDCGGEPVGCIAEGEERFTSYPDVRAGQVISPGGLAGVPQTPGAMQFMDEPWTNDACGTSGRNAWAISVGSCSKSVPPPHGRGVSMKQCSYIIVKRKQ